MASIGNLVVTIAANSKPFVIGVSAAIKAVTRFRSVVTALSGAAVAAWGKSAIAIGSELKDMSDRVGVSVEALGALKFAADQSDASFEALGNAFKLQAKFLHAAAGGSEEATKTLRTLGLSVQQLQALSPERRFKAFAAALALVPDIGERSVLAMQVFGRGAQELMPLLNEGATGIARLEKAAQGLGLLTGEEASNLEMLGDAFAQLWHMISVGGAKVAATFAPAIIAGIERTINAAKDMGVIIGVTIEHLRTNWREIFKDVGQFTVATLSFVWETAKVVAGNIVTAFRNLGAAIANAMATASADIAKQFSRAEGFVTGRSAQQQSDIEATIDEMHRRRQAETMTPFRPLPEFSAPANIPAISGLADALDSALAKDRAQRQSLLNLPGQGGPLAPLDGEGLPIRSKSEQDKRVGVASRGSREAFDVIAAAMAGKGTQPIVEATHQQTAQLLTGLQQVGAAITGVGGLGLIVPDLISGGGS